MQIAEPLGLPAAGFLCSAEFSPPRGREVLAVLLQSQNLGLVEFQLLACFEVSVTLGVCFRGEAKARSELMPSVSSFLLRCTLKTETVNFPKGGCTELFRSS